MIIPDALLLWSLEAVKSITNLIGHCLRINTETPKLEQSFPYKWVKLLMMDNESCNICNSWAVTGSLRRAFVLYSEHFKCFLSNIHTLMKTLGSSWASVSGTKHTVFVDDPSWATAELISENAKNISFVSHYSASTTAAFRWSHGINVKWLRTSFAVGVLCELNPFELSLFTSSHWHSGSQEMKQHAYSGWMHWSTTLKNQVEVSCPDYVKTKLTGLVGAK